MPVRVVRDRLGGCPRFALVGKFARDSKTVLHVALLGFDQPPENEERVVDVVEIFPPLLLGSDPDAGRRDEASRASQLFGRMKPDLVAWIELDQAELNELDFWLRDMREREASRHWEASRHRNDRDSWKDFILHPCRFPDEAPARFSCAGLVYSAYADSGLDLPLVDLDALPPIGIGEFVRVWEVFADPGLDPRRFGFVPHDGCALLLPGYLFHAVRVYSPGGPSYKPHAEDQDWQEP